MSCDQGHDTPHPTRMAGVSLRTHDYFDYPQIPGRFIDSFPIEVFDPTGLPQRGGYCPAFGPLHHNVFHVGAWEPPETIALLCASEALPDHTFLDFGANIGWFSVVMGRRDHGVLAFEGDLELAAILERNLEQNHVKDFGIIDEMVGPGTLGLDLDDRLIVKADIEGAELHAINMLDLDLVDAMLIELTPVFNAEWIDVVEQAKRAGFVWADLPEKSRPPVKFTSLNQLTWREDGLVSKMAARDQSNIMFVKPEVLK